MGFEGVLSLVGKVVFQVVFPRPLEVQLAFGFSRRKYVKSRIFLLRKPKDSQGCRLPSRVAFVSPGLHRTCARQPLRAGGCPAG